MSLVLFLQGAFGAMTASGAMALRPVIYTYSYGATRGTTDKRWLREGYPLRYINERSYDAERIPLSAEDVVICAGWTKDFFHGSPLCHCGLDPQSSIDNLDSGSEAGMTGSWLWHIHPSMLPMYRGYSAVSTQFLKGVALGGVTLYADNGQVDAGPIAWQQEISISMDDTPQTYLQRCADAALPWINALAGGVKPILRPQDERMAIHTVRLRRKDALLDFSAAALYVFNVVRAFGRPYSGAYFYHKGDEITLWKCAVEKWAGRHGKPGEVISHSRYGTEIACGEGSIMVSEIEMNNCVYTFDNMDSIL